MKNHHCLLLPLGLILIVVGLVSLIIVGLGSLEPYSYTKNFRSSTCTVISSEVSQYHDCDHINPKDTDLVIYSSGHSCIKVSVNYTRPDEVVENIASAFLYDSYDTWMHTHNYNISCSIHICQESEKDNEENVMNFQREYGQLGESFDCFYNPKNREEVFVYIPTSSHVLHAILWPSMALGFGIFILVVVLCSALEVWVCMPWRKKHQMTPPQKQQQQHKHSYELAKVKYHTPPSKRESTAFKV